MTHTIGIADTMFSRIDMHEIAKKTIEDSEESIKIERYTVPGVKDLPLACKKLLEEHNCDICLALGMPGPEKIDKTCAHEASQGLISTQLMTNKHILEVFIHLDEGNNKEGVIDKKKLQEITQNRVYDHTINAIALLKSKTALSNKAGQGIRQGHDNVGSL
ncbi:riboflavin synthase [Candidatus Woesearchaeota archaeon]|jgi:riboflavin synthase|nr:riboflavin synthase [Candidatus Woesearchaeota archaeon]MBT5272043.1 riboflavin synthase [Candidatus Woesearchaeota archaeon]MBT6041793.1 riboflavin synthase [Candidatus Woesearchaeota archaeon]MBT6336832.1 riboflavin synthase [Candidatus Woesearchaeota archaeon]MBT7927633.1 riboflavin synthase [Candidatus Woesearchaeota archaeon]